MSGAHKNYPINADGSRVCSKCGEKKSATNFRKYCVTYCYECFLKKARQNWLKKESTKDRKPPFLFENLLKEGKKECSSCGFIKTVDEFHRFNGTKNGYTATCKPCQAKHNKKYEAENRGIINFRRRERRKDPNLKIVFSLRSRQRCLFNSTGVRKPYKTTESIRKMLGCSIDDCRKHIESLFAAGMTWDNHGIGFGYWQIDHKIPVSLTEIREGKIIDNEINRSIWHYTNLQPLWHVDNAKKSNKYEPTSEFSMVRENRAAS